MKKWLCGTILALSGSGIVWTAPNWWPINSVLVGAMMMYFGGIALGVSVGTGTNGGA